MYLPQPDFQPDLSAMHRIIRDHPFGARIRSSTHGLTIEHLPFLFETTGTGDAVLLTHVARANKVWQEVEEGGDTLIAFTGAQGYISPSWYPGKHQTHRRVPTWNYEVVHVHGQIFVSDDERSARRVIALLTREHEAKLEKPWRMGDAPRDFLDALVQQIVAIEVRVTRMEGKRKLNQHHQLADREGAILGLRESGNHALADAMEATISR